MTVTDISTADVLTKTVFLKAAPERVWDYLTRHDLLGEWFHPARADLTSGEPYELLSPDENGAMKRICWGRVIRMDPPHTLVCTFTVNPLNGAETRLTWTLDKVSGGTRLTLVHDGIGEAAGSAALGLLTALDVGWDEHFGRLRQKVS